MYKRHCYEMDINQGEEMTWSDYVGLTRERVADKTLRL